MRNSGLFQAPNSKATRPPMASEPQGGGKGEGASGSKQAVSGVKPAEAKLAGYFMARAAVNQKIEGQELNNLRAGHETIQQVKALLPLGCANVYSDLEKAKEYHLMLRKGASVKLSDTLLDNHVERGGEKTETEINGAIAASAQFAQTGTCGCHAVNNLTLHGAKLADMGNTRAVVSYTVDVAIDHAWAEMHPKGVHADGTPILHGQDVILDGWCKEKVAILREDNQYARLDRYGKAAHLIHEDPLDYESGPEALKVLEKYKARIENDPFYQDVFHREFHRLAAANVKVPEEYFCEEWSVFHTDFQRRAGNALHSERGVLAEIQAVGVARSLGSNIRGAIADAPGIITSAKDMFPIPESSTSRFFQQVLRAFGWWG